MKYKDYNHIIWFMFGMISMVVNEMFGWWGLLFIPLWFILNGILQYLSEYQPKQRTLNDYKEVEAKVKCRN